MTYDQYWYGDTQMARAFYEAEKLRQELENTNAWLHGIYVYRALDSTVGNMFRKTGSELAKYPSKPLRLDGERVKMDDEEEKTYALAYMSSMVEAGKNWKQQGGKRL